MSRSLVAAGGIVVLVWLSTSPAALHAQQADTERDVARIKSALLLNFARFTTWPAETFADDESPLAITVIDEPPLLPYLRAIVRDQQANGRRIEIRTLRYPDIDPDAPDDTEAAARVDAFYAALRQSHMVFLPQSHNHLMTPLIDQLRDAPVLLVSDAPGFVEAGGALQLRLWQQRIVFDANADAIKLSSVDVSSKVLALARYVKREQP